MKCKAYDLLKPSDEDARATSFGYFITNLEEISPFYNFSVVYYEHVFDSEIISWVHVA